ncbi:MAG: flagellar assembly protein FliH [Sulfurospirillaceae bacterium]|nr:flagellar assembly protein FliH [Sulfurospirillaceae bacterium]MDD2825523.1 flagellar assembly protein FliH [Sulfurospirillaceae bacterium]
MADNIIDKQQIDDHSVQRYRFKVLGSSLTEGQTHSSDEENAIETRDDLIAPLFDEVTTPPSRLDEGQNQFVEELLKKTDELSSNIIKLQMQIEKQELEFSNRLNEELKRERESSYSLGYQKAKEESEVQNQEIKSRYLKSISQLETLYKQMENSIAKVESDLIETACEIAREVIKKEVKTSSAQIAQALSKELIKELKDASKIELKVNPRDFEVLKESYLKDEKIKVTSDDSITLGGIVVLSDIGNLDGNLTMRLEKVKYLIQDKEN